MALSQTEFLVRHAQHADLNQLVLLENEWPAAARASAEVFSFRIDYFQQGYFVAEDETGIFASIIACPYFYYPKSLDNFQNWEMVVNKCYDGSLKNRETNALYIVSGTSKATHHGSKVFDTGIRHVVALAKQLGKRYVVGGCLLPGYARYLEKNNWISAADYVKKQVNGRYIDPLIDKYHKLKFTIPDNQHIIADYFPDAASLNYSALVVYDSGETC